MNFLWTLLFLGSTIGVGKLEERSSAPLKKLLQDPQVAKRHQQCQTLRKSPAFDMGKCLWEGDKEGKLPPLPAAERERLQKLIAGRQQEGLAPLKSSTDPALKKLEDFYAKRLRQALYPEGEPANLDHFVFNRLYRTQLGKNIISSISSYCLEADSDNKYLIEQSLDERKKTRRKNLATIKQIQGEQSAAYRSWQVCMINLPHICHDTNPDKSKESYCEDCKNFKVSQQRACEVVSYIKTARQNLIALDKIDTRWKDLSRQHQAVALLGGRKKDISVEEITTLSSKEFIEKSGYKKALAKMELEAKECAKNFDPQKCRGFVDDKENKVRQLADEHELRTRVVQEKIRKLASDTDSQDELKAYLKEEGHSDARIGEMLKGDVQDIKDQIAKRFEQQREALRRSLNDRIERHHIDGQDRDFAGKKMQAVRDDLQDRQERLAQLVFFNNMISGFLSFKGEKGKDLGSNSRALFHELSDSVFEEEFAEAKGKLKKIARPVEENPGMDTSVDVGTINEVLRYEQDQSPK